MGNEWKRNQQATRCDVNCTSCMRCALIVGRPMSWRSAISCRLSRCRDGWRHEKRRSTCGNAHDSPQILAESKESVNTFFAHTEITSEDLYVWSEKPRRRRHHVWLFDPDKRLIMLIGMAVCPAYLTNLHTEDWEDVFLPADMVELIGEFSEGEPPFALHACGSISAPSHNGIDMISQLTIPVPPSAKTLFATVKSGRARQISAIQSLAGRMRRGNSRASPIKARGTKTLARADSGRIGLPARFG